MADKTIITVAIDEPGEPGKVAQYEKMGDVSDGYHTFDELYEFRKAYNALLFNEWYRRDTRYERHGIMPVKSKRHSDGELCFGGGWFVVSANTRCGQITNHYELKDWDLFRIPEVDKAPEWDGHTPQQALERLLDLARGPEVKAEGENENHEASK